MTINQIYTYFCAYMSYFFDLLRIFISTHLIHEKECRLCAMQPAFHTQAQTNTFNWLHGSNGGDREYQFKIIINFKSTLR